jgi:hypothetical protein
MNLSHKNQEQPSLCGGSSSVLSGESLVKSSRLYKQHLERNEEINKHKWYESERAGKDVGIDHAFFDWLFKHSSDWKNKNKTP